MYFDDSSMSMHYNIFCIFLYLKYFIIISLKSFYDLERMDSKDLILEMKEVNMRN